MLKACVPQPVHCMESGIQGVLKVAKNSNTAHSPPEP